MATLLDFFEEMQSFVNISEETLQAAKKSKINEKNSPKLKQLVKNWVNGLYDEDPELLVQELERLLP